MSVILVAIDVGASRTRVRTGSSPEEFGSSTEPLIRDIGSATDLMAFLAEVRAGLPTHVQVYLSGGIAAPPIGDDVRVMTNWPDDGRVSISAIKKLGYDRVHLMNDLEAAAHGLAAFLEDAPHGDDLVSFGGGPVPESGNRAIVIPGSGLGSAGIVDLGVGRDPRWKIVPTEVGHAMAGWEEHDELLRRVEGHLGRPPTWEDCVSGPGLKTLWAAGGNFRDDPIGAPEVALRASNGDARAQEALDHYYLLAARFSQVLALSFLSTGGLYLAGGSTRSNAPLIPEEGFLRAFRDNPRMGALLEEIPVFLVLAEINLLGPWRLGWRRLART
jgi:glucokinase